MYCYIFPLKMYGYILESQVVGEPIAESRVVGEPIVAWKNVLLHFSPQNVRVHFGIMSSGRTYRWITSSGRAYLSLQKRFSVSVVVQTEMVFSFLRGRQRTAETVFSFHRCTDGNGFQFLASLAENGGNGFQFPNDLSKNIVAGASSQKNPSLINPKSLS